MTKHEITVVSLALINSLADNVFSYQEEVVAKSLLNKFKPSVSDFLKEHPNYGKCFMDNE